ncbi:hypothetical protein BC938DRAFT_471877 [Jimgerdemannia flammicorona]|uniref:RNI-like protein n=1 Tax=Jimgerdemannia flammicorona TaxID=994334 RepID=A0A433Q747_9FUNG|nr:hypothetical protein BC938DRAFT_471877 [Jimgerdemannia flammicorona]
MWQRDPQSRSVQSSHWLQCNCTTRVCLLPFMPQAKGKGTGASPASPPPSKPPRKRQRTRSRRTTNQSDLIEWVEASESRYSTQISQNASQQHRNVAGQPLSLRTVCIRAFSANVRRLGSSANPSFFRLSLLPPDILAELADALRTKDPADLNPDLVHAVYLSSDLPRISLDGLSWVTGTTLARFAQIAVESKGGYANLRHLNLNNQTNLGDTVVAKIVPHLYRIDRLELKGCVKVGEKTLTAVAEHCAGTLRHLNVGITGATAGSLECIIRNCRSLETLKLVALTFPEKAFIGMLERTVGEPPGASLSSSSPVGSTSNTAKSQASGKGSKKPTASDRGKHQNSESETPALAVTAQASSPSPAPLSKLRNLKLSSTSISNIGLTAFLRLCGRTLERLDISNTRVTRLQPIINHCIVVSSASATSSSPSPAISQTVQTNLEKLNITQTYFHLQDLVLLLTHLSNATTIPSTTTVGGSSTIRKPSATVTTTPTPKLHTLLAGQLLINRDHTLLTNASLDYLAPPFSQLTRLRRLSLFGNTRVGSGGVGGPVWRLLRQTRQSLRQLDMSRTIVKRGDLRGLVDKEEKIEEAGQEIDGVRNEVLEELDVSFTPVDDDVSRVGGWVGG